MALAGTALALLLALAALALTRARVARARGRLALRILAALALGAALADPALTVEGRPIRVELLDVSASFRPRRGGAEALLAAARRAAAEAGAETVRIAFAGGVGEAASPDATDLPAALAAALAAGPSEVLLASDGLSSAPGTLEAAARLAARGVEVHVACPPTGPGRSLAIASVRVPTRARPGERIEVEVGVTWSGPGALEATLSGPGGPLTVRLPAEGGTALARLEATAPTAPGLHLLPLVLAPRLEDDLVPEDEAARPAVLVEPPGALLVVAAPGAAVPEGPLAARLSGATRIAPSDVPAQAAALAGFEAVILLDAPVGALGPSGAEALAAYVEAGGGLLAAGARSAFGAGGYARSPLERVLPVLSEPPPAGERLGLIVALDRSGSMGEEARPGTSKYVAALDELSRALAALGPDDVVGAIVFARDPEVARAPAPLGDPAALARALAGRPTSGETDIFPALRAALEAARAVDAPRRHVLLVSDGRSEASADPGAALRALEAPPGVTVSVVSVGRDADRALLGAIAARGRGRFVESAAGGEALFEALSREADPRRAPPVIEGPVALSGGGALESMARVAPKEGARVLEAVPGAGPLLAEGAAGAGLAVAFTSGDLAPRAAALVSALERVARPEGARGFTLRFVEAAGGLALEASAPTPTALAARVEGLPAPLALEEVAPRRYRAPVPSAPGPLVAALVRREGGRPLVRAVHAPPRPIEHVPAPPDAALLRAIASTTGGRLLGPDEIPPPPPALATGGRARAGHLAALAALLVLALDLALGALSRPAEIS
jgi:hypothetical protein